MNYGLAEITRFIRETTYNDEYPLKKMTQEALAQKIGKSTCEMSMYENGLAEFPLDVLSKIANIYHLPIKCFSPFFGNEHFTKGEKMDALYTIFAQVSKSQYDNPIYSMHTTNNTTNCISDIYLIFSFIRILSGYSRKKLCVALNEVSIGKKISVATIKKLETPGNIPTDSQILRYVDFFKINDSRFIFWINKPNACIADKKQNLYAIYATITNTRAKDLTEPSRWM